MVRHRDRAKAVAATREWKRRHPDEVAAQKRRARARAREHREAGVWPAW